MWRLSVLAAYALFTGYAGGWPEGLLALAGGLIALCVLRVLDAIGDRVGEGIQELVDRGDRRDRLVRELLARLEGRR